MFVVSSSFYVSFRLFQVLNRAHAVFYRVFRHDRSLVFREVLIMYSVFQFHCFKCCFSFLIAAVAHNEHAESQTPLSSSYNSH